MVRQSNNKVDIAVINANISDIKDDVREIKQKLEIDYCTKAEFDPVKKVVYGLVGLILTAVVGSLIALVIIK
jgi:hypothetical protein